VLVLIVGALEKVMGNCFRDESTAVRADWRYGAAYAKEVLVERRVGCTKLCWYGGLTMVKTVNQFEIAV